jgi:thioredoxin reductase (NADPH)
MYGAPWCPDCRRAKQFFGDQRVLYDWINVDDNPDSMKYVEQVNGDKQIISTIVFENVSVLVEPTTAELAEKLSIRPKATRLF